jgi:muconate cycloisomerase
MEIADLARASGVGVMLGAQVGESAILSAAGRGYAAVKGPFDNCEGSFNRYLLRQDLSADDVTLGKEGRAPVFDRPGIGVEIDEWRVKRFTVASESEVSSSDSNQKSGELTRSMV